ncbi:HTH domain-containing protein [Halorientalis halophila]|uniref:HTH domain-containing protein n=1 Tax=Halorientalis halophila TaxID=3108499 RepID=UPI00300BBC0F
MSTNTDSLRLELYVRTLSPPGARTRQEEVIERLQRLEDEGQITDFYVKVWGRQIDPTTNAADTDQGQFILNRIAEFKQWALAENTTLESFYQTHEQSSSITGQDHTTIVLPKMGLAEYEGTELQQVTPCTEGDEVTSVINHLDELERRLTDQPTELVAPTPVAEE